MQRRPVDSSNVSSIGWEPEEEGAGLGTMEVEFRSGHVYRYLDVPESEYQALVGSSSIGRYLARSVVGTYEEERVR